MTGPDRAAKVRATAVAYFLLFLSALSTGLGPVAAGGLSRFYLAIRRFSMAQSDLAFYSLGWGTLQFLTGLFTRLMWDRVKMGYNDVLSQFLLVVCHILGFFSGWTFIVLHVGEILAIPREIFVTSSPRAPLIPEPSKKLPPPQASRAPIPARPDAQPAPRRLQPAPPQKALRLDQRILRLARDRGSRGFTFTDAVLELDISTDELRPSLEKLMNQDLIESFTGPEGRVLYRELCERYVPDSRPAPQPAPQPQPLSQRILILARESGQDGFNFNEIVIQLGLPPEDIRPELEKLMGENLIEIFNDEEGRILYREL